MAITKISFVSPAITREFDAIGYSFQYLIAGNKKIPGKIFGKDGELRFTSGRGKASETQYYVYFVIEAEKEFLAYSKLTLEEYEELRKTEEFEITKVEKTEEKEEEKNSENSELPEAPKKRVRVKKETA